MIEPYYQEEGITLFCAKCEDVLPQATGTMLMTDPPYGDTGEEWDIRVDPLELTGVRRGVMFGNLKLAIELSKHSEFRYELIWTKNSMSNLENTPWRPARQHEYVMIFGKLPYTPQKRRRTIEEMKRLNSKQRKTMEFSNPGSVLEFDVVNNRNGERTKHPCQKPVDLMGWLIASYSDESETLLDPFAGSGTTLVAAKRLKRKAIGIEQSEDYCRITVDRLRQHEMQFDDNGHGT